MVSSSVYRNDFQNASGQMGDSGKASPRERGGLRQRRHFLFRYKDFLDKSRAKVGAFVAGLGFSTVVLDLVQHEVKAVQMCGNTALKGECDTGHQFLKVVRCGREFCPTCGHKGSDIHMQRYSRIVPKIQQMEEMGYFVIQWPVSFREAMREKQVLADIGSRVGKLFKQMGYERGIRTWDWFGDPKCPYCAGPGMLLAWRDQDNTVYKCKKGHEFTLGEVRSDWMRFNPHLNVLIEEGFLERDRLEAIKKFLRGHLGVPDLIVNYHYVAEDDPRRVGRMLHHARYVVKPTFLNLEWDPALVGVLKGIRSVFYWGRWKKGLVWELPVVDEGDFHLSSVVSLQRGVCPACFSAVKWHGLMVMSAGVMAGYVAVGAGYWMLESSIVLLESGIDGT